VVLAGVVGYTDRRGSEGQSRAFRMMQLAARVVPGEQKPQEVVVYSGAAEAVAAWVAALEEDSTLVGQS
jgi:hypothetical protein